MHCSVISVSKTGIVLPSTSSLESTHQHFQDIPQVFFLKTGGRGPLWLARIPALSRSPISSFHFRFASRFAELAGRGDSFSFRYADRRARRHILKTVHLA